MLNHRTSEEINGTNIGAPWKDRPRREKILHLFYKKLYIIEKTIIFSLHETEQFNDKGICSKQMDSLI